MRRLLCIVSLTLVSQAQATSCGPAAFGWSAKRAELIVQAEVVRIVPSTRPGITPPLYMDVRVLSTYLGKAPARVLRVRGDDGNAPYPYITNYPVGTRWILGLEKRNFPRGERLPGNLYAPVGCTGQGLLVSGGWTHGVWSPLRGDQLVPLGGLKARIRQVRARSEEELRRSLRW
ncbi:hypothetical protein V3W47_04115 [Deinococcus sp. YIM 134068]|uniref:hypothetical protein n=1 Tax=Deinococcus lichenicola TaxID=3118910 RepID=UPI002F92B112